MVGVKEFLRLEDADPKSHTMRQPDPFGALAALREWAEGGVGGVISVLPANCL